MLIFKRTDYTKKLRVVNALLCWLRCCVHCLKDGIRLALPVVYHLSNSAHSSCPNSTRLQPTQQGIHHTRFFV